MQLNPTTRTELFAMMRQAINIELQLFHNRIGAQKVPEIYSRKEAAHLLKINLSTLADYTNRKLIVSQKTGGRRYYKREDIENFLNNATNETNFTTSDFQIAMEQDFQIEGTPSVAGRFEFTD